MRHLILPGVQLILLAIWGGAYLIGLLHWDDWRVVPIGITAGLIGIAGFALTITGICEPPRKS